MTTAIFQPRLLPLCFGFMTYPWLASVAHTAELNLSFQPRVDVGVVNYSLDFGSTAQLFGELIPPEQISTTKLSFSDVMPTVSAGLTVFANRFYLDIHAESAFDGSVNDSNHIFSSTPGFMSTTHASFKSDVTRNDYAVTAGYGISDTVSLFAGWKWASAEFDGMRGGGTLQTVDGTALGVFETGGDYKFKYDGPFVGAAIGWPISYRALEGNLALNIGVAFLDGDFSVSSGFATLNGIPMNNSPSAIFGTSGDTIGTTLGLSWRGATGVQQLSYSLGVKAYRYDFDANDTGKADISETFVQLKVGLAYAF